MNLGNFLKTALLRIRKQNLGRGKIGYRLSLRDVLLKLFTRRYILDIGAVMCGFPRSGTHWIRNVIEKSTGLYCPSDIEIDYEKAIDQKKIPVIKIHARSPLVLKVKMFVNLPLYRFNRKYIYVYRDPRDAIISLYQMYNIQMGTNISQNEFLDKYDPIGQYKWEINSWVLKAKNKDILPIRFEDLKNDSYNTFKKIFNFLEIKGEVNMDSLSEMVGVVEDNSRPKGKVGGWRNLESEYQVLIQQTNELLKKEINILNY